MVFGQADLQQVATREGARGHIVPEKYPRTTHPTTREVHTTRPKTRTTYPEHHTTRKARQTHPVRKTDAPRVTAKPKAKKCGETCRFAFCTKDHEYFYDPHFFFGVPDQAFTPAICDPTKHVIVGHVDEAGEAHVWDHYRFTPISHFHPDGLSQKYTPSFFKTYGIGYGYDLSGVGHETPQGNQAELLDGKCIVLPLKAYQILDYPSGTVIDNIHPSPDSRYEECVAFTIKYPKY